MNAKDYILSRRVPKTHDITIALADGVECRFLIPLSGVGRSSLERKCAEFSKAKPNLVFVGKGLMPAEGFDESIAYGLRFMAETNQEGWTVQDVLELYDANPLMVMAVFQKLIAEAMPAMRGAESEEAEEELKNSEAILSTDG